MVLEAKFQLISNTEALLHFGFKQLTIKQTQKYKRSDSKEE